MTVPGQMSASSNTWSLSSSGSHVAHPVVVEIGLALVQHERQLSVRPRRCRHRLELASPTPSSSLGFSGWPGGSCPWCRRRCRCRRRGRTLAEPVPVEIRLSRVGRDGQLSLASGTVSLSSSGSQTSPRPSWSSRTDPGWRASCSCPSRRRSRRRPVRVLRSEDVGRPGAAITATSRERPRPLCQPSAWFGPPSSDVSFASCDQVPVPSRVKTYADPEFGRCRHRRSR